jgi:hypothetical protein
VGITRCVPQIECPTGTTDFSGCCDSEKEDADDQKSSLHLVGVENRFFRMSTLLDIANVLIVKKGLTALPVFFRILKIDRRK